MADQYRHSHRRQRGEDAHRTQCLDQARVTHRLGRIGTSSATSRLPLPLPLPLQHHPQQRDNRKGGSDQRQQIAGMDEGDDDTPILVATPQMDVPSRALLINLRDAAPAGSFQRVLEVVPADPAARGPLRERWKHYQALGFELNKYDM